MMKFTDFLTFSHRTHTHQPKLKSWIISIKTDKHNQLNAFSMYSIELKFEFIGCVIVQTNTILLTENSDSESMLV